MSTSTSDAALMADTISGSFCNFKIAFINWDL